MGTALPVSDQWTLADLSLLSRELGKGSRPPSYTTGRTDRTATHRRPLVYRGVPDLRPPRSSCRSAGYTALLRDLHRPLRPPRPDDQPLTAFRRRLRSVSVPDLCLWSVGNSRYTARAARFLGTQNLKSSHTTRTGNWSLSRRGRNLDSLLADRIKSGPGETRTRDLCHAKAALSQLSYGPTFHHVSQRQL